MTSSPVRDKLIVDSIHGDIKLKPDECRVIDTASFQRLRHLKQLQFGHLTYPGATHTRFAHSVGVLGILARVGERAREDLGLKDEQIQELRLAGLLHDVGHYPYSHLMERIDKVTLAEEFVEGGEKTISRMERPYPNHEAVGHAIVTAQPDLLDVLGSERAAHIANLFRRAETADSQSSKLVHSSLDMDRLDYLIRDARATGVPYGQVDLNYLLNNLKASPEGVIGVREKAVTAVDHFLLGRFFMYRTVYYHKTTFGLEEGCRQLLRRARDAGLFGMPKDGDEVLVKVRGGALGTFTDAFVDRVIEQAAEYSEPVIRALANCIRRRRPPRLLREVQVLQRTGTKAHAGSLFWTNCRCRLQKLAERHGLPLGRFLVAETPPLTLEKRGTWLTEEEARKLERPEKEEIIRVFRGDEVEPVSILQVDHSILHLCSNHFFQAFRLYLVPDDDTDDGLARRLRDEVKQWK